jgi:hypothetical protein
MDYSSLAITVAILLYGLYEYRRRERIHRVDMEFLRRRIEPPQDSELIVPRWRILTVAVTALITLAVGGVMVFRGIVTPRYGSPLIVIGCFFLLLAAPLILMILRDRRIPRGRLGRTV